MRHHYSKYIYQRSQDLSIFVISDLHLSTNTDKSMEVFGSRWQNYCQRLENNWNKVVSPEDTVIVPGDISWALSLEEAIPDLLFLESLNGTKIIGKGNHDFWWSTLTKIETVFKTQKIKTIKILHNNAYIVENIVVCGTRGWYTDSHQQNAVNAPDYEKIINRELIRLKISLDEAVKLKGDSDLKIIVFFHFPPVWNDFVSKEFLGLLSEYNISDCFFGHIHGNYGVNQKFSYNNVNFQLVSSDFLNFTPIPIIID